MAFLQTRTVKDNEPLRLPECGPWTARNIFRIGVIVLL